MMVSKYSALALAVLLLVAAAGAQNTGSNSAPLAAHHPFTTAGFMPADQEVEIRAIREVLTKSADAWNRGDLESYMQAYWNSPETTFAGGAAITKGYDNTLALYKKNYQAPGKEMGKLDYPDISPQFLCADAALVRGKWHLKMTSGKEPHGVFSLTMKKFPEGWRIIHDHSSVGE